MKAPRAKRKPEIGTLSEKLRLMFADRGTVSYSDVTGIPPETKRAAFMNLHDLGEIKRLRFQTGRYGADATYIRADLAPDLVSATVERPKHFDAGLQRMIDTKKPGETFTLDEIAAQCGVTRERVRQIEQSALKKCRRILDRAGIKLADLVEL